MRNRILTLAAAALAAAPASAAPVVGSCRQPAIHEDRLVFVSEGDLWTADVPPAPAEGAAETPITAHRLTTGAHAAQPRVSADGTTIAFAARWSDEDGLDVYVMPIDGGPPRRLTFAAGDDVPLAWTPDGAEILFRSARAHPLGRGELWRVPARGGMPVRHALGECATLGVSATGRVLAFTTWSRASGSRRRGGGGGRAGVGGAGVGGAAPEIWIADTTSEAFRRLTDGDADDADPMWLAGRVYFVSDEDGAPNIHSDLPQGGDRRRHTRFAPDPDVPTAADTYPLRDASAAAERRGRRIVFSQGGALALFDVVDERVRRLDVRLASDRAGAREHLARVGRPCKPALSPDGRTVVMAAGGDIVACDVRSGRWWRVTRTPRVRERAPAWLDDARVLFISDEGGEEQIAVAPADGSSTPGFATEDREVWLMPPRAAPDATSVAFGDATRRLHLLDLRTLIHRQIARGDAGPITDYRFSADGRWLAWTEPLAQGVSRIRIHAVRTGRDFAVTGGQRNDREPRWDPAGRYLYYLSGGARAGPAELCVVPLTIDTPPPLAGAGLDLEAWAAAAEAAREAPAGGVVIEPDEAGPAPGEAAPPKDDAHAIRVDTEDLTARRVAIPVDPAPARGLEALPGAVSYLAEGGRGARGAGAEGGASGPRGPTLHRHDLVRGAGETIASGVRDYVTSADGLSFAWTDGRGFLFVRGPEDEAPIEIDLSGVAWPEEPRDAWQRAFSEAWRRCRDLGAVADDAGQPSWRDPAPPARRVMTDPTPFTWSSVRARYEALLARAGTAAEVDDVIAAMAGEVGAAISRANAPASAPAPVEPGLLGADLAPDGPAVRVVRILTAPAWHAALASPLQPAHLGVREGTPLLAIDGRTLDANSNPHELLLGLAGRPIDITVGDATPGSPPRTITLTPLRDETDLRYADHVEHVRLEVDAASDGRAAYVHVRDTSAQGAALLADQLAFQTARAGLIVDLRGCAGGPAGDLILERLMRHALRDSSSTAPAPPGPAAPPAATPAVLPMVVLVDAHTRAEGESLAAALRAGAGAIVIGTRTRGDDAAVVVPDVEAAVTPADRVAGRDPVVLSAVEKLGESE